MGMLTYKVEETEGTLRRFGTSWSLSDDEKECLSYYALRQWTALELAEQLRINESGGLEVKLWDHRFIPVPHKLGTAWEKIKYLATEGREFLDPINNKPVMFWVSFRAGSTLNGTRFAFAIIQEDLAKQSRQSKGRK